MKIKRNNNFLVTGSMFLGADKNDPLGLTGWRVAHFFIYSDFDLTQSKIQRSSNRIYSKIISSNSWDISNARKLQVAAARDTWNSCTWYTICKCRTIHRRDATNRNTSKKYQNVGNRVYELVPPKIGFLNHALTALGS